VQKTSDKSQRSQQLCKDVTLQDEGYSSPTRHNPAGRLDGEDGPEGCMQMLT